MSSDGETTKSKAEPQKITIKAGDFTFESEIFGSKTFLADYAISQGIALEMMAKHYEFYGQLNKVSKIEGYVTREAVITCDCGDHDRLLDAYVDHGVIGANGKPLMTCNDCKINENIYNFGLCSPKVQYSRNLPHPSGNQEKNDQGEMCYKCMPVLGEKWRQRESDLLIGDIEGEEFVEALKEGACLTCRYGGIIEVTGLPDTVVEEQEEILPLETAWLDEHFEGDYVEYVSMEDLDALGWVEIQDYYVDMEGNRSDWQDTFQSDGTFEPDPEIDRHHRFIDKQDILNLNRVLIHYDITTYVRICAFMAQITHECACGSKMCEPAGNEEHPFNGPTTRSNLKKWYDTYQTYPYQYRGGGTIHLTGEGNYKEVAERIGDSNILSSTEHVAFNYPWLCAGVYWQYKKINEVEEDFSKITYRINGGWNNYEQRLRLFERCQEVFERYKPS